MEEVKASSANLCLLLKGGEWLPFCRARWVAEMESEISAYFSLTRRRKMIEQKCSRELCGLCLPEIPRVLCILFTCPEDWLLLHLLALTLLSGLFLSIPVSGLCWDKRNESIVLSWAHQLRAFPLHYTAALPAREELPLLSACRPPRLYTLTHVLEEEFGMLALPESFAKTIELSRQFPLTLSLCKFPNHMVWEEFLDYK